MTAFDYLRAESLDQALAALATGNVTVLAGGTDLYPAHVGRPLPGPILDVSGLAELAGIETDEAGWRIGAASTWTRLLQADLPPLFDGLKLAAREIGGIQIQNAGTIGGNLCNASPAADGVPVLLSLDAAVELASARGRRTLPLADFVRGNRRTARDGNELLTTIHVPRPRRPARGHFLKLGARRYLVISIVMVAGTIEADDDGGIAAAKIAVGSCAETALRLPALEAALVGRPLGESCHGIVADADLGALSPIDDCRGTGAYRRDAARTLIRRLLADLGNGW